MEINECPKFDRCSAPICPLDPYWNESTYLRGEPVCLYLREAAKGVDLGLIGVLPLGMPLIVGKAFRQIIHTVRIPNLVGHGDLRRRLVETAKSGSVIAKGHQYRARVTGTEAAE